VLGRTIFYKETPYTVAGVAQAGFDGIESEARVDVWVPVASDVPSQAWLVSPQISWLKLVARIPSANDPRRVEGALEAAFRAHVTEKLLPRTRQPHFRAVFEAQYLKLRPASAGLSTTGRKYQEPLLILMAVVALVLLISCANVANLAMARNRARRNQIAVRLALGASRGRIVSQLLTECLLLAFCGTACALVLAEWSCHLLILLLPEAQPPLAYDIRPDSATLAFAAAAGVVTAILFGLGPALRASRGGANPTVGTGARTTGRFLAGRALVAGQLALSLLLLTGAGLFLATVRNIAAIDLGFQPEGVATFDVSFPKGMTDPQVVQADEAIRERLLASPGVAAASYAYPDVYGNGGWSLGVEVEGRAGAPGEDNETGVIGAGPGFFETMRLPLLQGRYLTVRDLAGASPVAVVNERFARYYFGAASPLGRRIKLGGADQPFREIVGVVRDARHYGAREPVWRMAYLPASQEGSFLVRGRGGAHALGGIIRSAVSGSGSSAQVERVGPLQDIVDALAGRERMIAALSAAFGALAALLASIGLYGVMAYGVAGRTPELGIRIAVGAQPSDVVRLILKETMQLVAAGGCAGLAAAAALTRLVSSMLYGVRPDDPGILAGSALVLAAVALVAGYLPARRASRIDPTVALRHD